MLLYLIKLQIFKEEWGEGKKTEDPNKKQRIMYHEPL